MACGAPLMAGSSCMRISDVCDPVRQFLEQSNSITPVAHTMTDSVSFSGALTQIGMRLVLFMIP